MPIPHRYIYEYRGEDMPLKRIGVVRCTCGSEIHCHDAWSNACDRCGTEFNGNGQRLNPRSMWGDDTGERFF